MFQFRLFTKIGSTFENQAWGSNQLATGQRSSGNDMPEFPAERGIISLVGDMDPSPNRKHYRAKSFCNI